MNPPTPLAVIETEGARLARIARTDPARRTDALRDLAGLVIDLRRHHLTDEGQPDWRGRTWLYRQHAAALYETWGIAADSAGNLQAALRYHVGNRLRELVEVENLDAVGLKRTSPRERLARPAQIRAAVADAIAAVEADEASPPAERLDRLLAILKDIIS